VAEQATKITKAELQTFVLPAGSREKLQDRAL